MIYLEKKKCSIQLVPELGPRFLYKILNKSKLAFILPNYKASRRIGPHSNEIISILVGSLLGDGKGERLKNGGIKFKFRQQIKHKEYLFFIYDYLNKRGYCTNNLPTLYVEGEEKKLVYKFGTYGFTSLMWLYKLFYNNKKIKVMPKNIGDLLTPLALSILIMDNGIWKNSETIIVTKWFKKKEVDLLLFTIQNKFKINCSIHKSKGKYHIHIHKESNRKLRELVLPYMVPNMFYKLGL